MIFLILTIIMDVSAADLATELGPGAQDRHQVPGLGDDLSPHLDIQVARLALRGVQAGPEHGDGVVREEEDPGSPGMTCVVTVILQQHILNGQGHVDG